MNPSVISERLERFEACCASEGIALTPQRRVVMEILAQRTDHPTVDQVFQAVSARMRGVSKATIYRTLETLCDLNLIRRVHHPGSAVRLDPNVGSHHHFLCKKCDRITDLPLDAVGGHDGLSVDPNLVGGEVEQLSVTVQGLCMSCG